MPETETVQAQARTGLKSRKVGQMADDLKTDATENPETGDEVAKDEKDYKAEYEKLKKYSREWESRAKANAEKAKAYDKLKEQEMTETEKLQKQLEDAQTELQALRSQRDYSAWVNAASDETGVSAKVLSLIRADSQDEMLENAKVIADAFSEMKGSPLPAIAGDGAHVDPKPHVSANDYIRAQFARTR